ncbi:hypothetical protein VTN00DRAFT_2546 [Thermoascus crustaceus]|uniref:uncharacterized protein n=1 Tax=Thermoascus crustaceus TaxID=5088 RepID=UPI0037423600
MGTKRWRINKILPFSYAHPAVIGIFRAEKAQPIFNRASPVVMATIGPGFVTTDNPGVEFILLRCISKRNELADWFDAFASFMELHMWLETTIKSATYGDTKGEWTVQLIRG